jgi:O-antigen/teichoic acid export membrane protein
VQRVFGPSGAALFARTKLLSAESKKSAFAFLYRKCWYVVISLSTVFFINGKQLLSLKLGEQPLSLWVVIYIFSLSHVLETLFILYDKLFAAEELAHYSAFVNSISFILCVSWALISSSLMITLLWCCIIRLIAFFCLTIIAHKTCNISLPYKLPFKKLFIPFAVSVCVAILIRFY